jgi:hypothetical protein
MDQSEHIIALITECEDYGYPKKETKKVIDEFLKPDYIPRNSKIYYGSIKNQINDALPALPGMRCSQVIADDIQSGPIYCGKSAYLHAEITNNLSMFFILCEKHAKRHGVSL